MPGSMGQSMMPPAVSSTVEAPSSSVYPPVMPSVPAPSSIWSPAPGNTLSPGSSNMQDRESTVAPSLRPSVAENFKPEVNLPEDRPRFQLRSVERTPLESNPQAYKPTSPWPNEGNADSSQGNANQGNSFKPLDEATDDLELKLNMDSLRPIPAPKNFDATPDWKPALLNVRDQTAGRDSRVRNIDAQSSNSNSIHEVKFLNSVRTVESVPGTVLNDGQVKATFAPHSKIDYPNGRSATIGRRRIFQHQRLVDRHGAIMPANLTPQYLRAEKAYRQAISPQEQLEALQNMLREIPKHKGTDRLQADLKSKIARLKIEAMQKPSAASRSPLKLLQRQGAGRVLLIGAPNVGKSQLLAALSRAKPLVADYPYSTQSPLPGMMTMEDCPIQLVDMPPISIDYFYPDTYDLVRTADLVFWVIDLSSPNLIEDSQSILDRFQSGKTRLGRQSRHDETAIGTTYTQTLVVLNKVDIAGDEENVDLLDEFLKIEFDRVLVSGAMGDGSEQLPREAFRRLDIIRVYAKDPRDREIERTQPYLLRRGDTLMEFASQIHDDLAESTKGARVWNATLDECSIVKPDYQPEDGDVIELQT